jgi:hypothetical protein
VWTPRTGAAIVSFTGGSLRKDTTGVFNSAALTHVLSGTMPTVAKFPVSLAVGRSTSAAVFTNFGAGDVINQVKAVGITQGGVTGTGDIYITGLGGLSGVSSICANLVSLDCVATTPVGTGRAMRYVAGAAVVDSANVTYTGNLTTLGSAPLDTGGWILAHMNVAPTTQRGVVMALFDFSELLPLSLLQKAVNWARQNPGYLPPHFLGRI